MCNDMISIIMSTYNEPVEWIQKAINSILGQNYKNIEFIIVCDNPKNNDLIKLLEEYKVKDDRIVTLYNDVNIGLTKSLNKAINKATGKYIVRMDSDDISGKFRIEKQLSYLKKNNLDLIGAGVKCITEQEEAITNLNKFPKESKEFNKKILYNNCMPHPTWFGKKEVFEILEGYREVDFAEDYDFLLRACYKGFKLGNINEILLDYRMRESSISNKNGLKQFITSQELVKAYKENYILNLDKLSQQINEKITCLSNGEINKYLESSKLFSQGVKGLNPIKVVKSICISKYYRKKVMCYVRGMF